MARADGPQPRALRLTFSYEGDRVELVDRREVEMTVPASSDLERYEQRSGSWVELRATDGRPLYRRVLDRIIPTDVEIVPEAEGGPFTRALLPDRRGTFDVLVPVLDEAESLAVLTSAPTREVDAAKIAARAVPATEVVVLTLHDLPREKGE
jgi:hypothetical protein